MLMWWVGEYWRDVPSLPSHFCDSMRNVTYFLPKNWCWWWRFSYSPPKWTTMWLHIIAKCFRWTTIPTVLARTVLWIMYFHSLAHFHPKWNTASLNCQKIIKDSIIVSMRVREHPEFSAVLGEAGFLSQQSNFILRSYSLWPSRILKPPPLIFVWIMLTADMEMLSAPCLLQTFFYNKIVARP